MSASVDVAVATGVMKVGQFNQHSDSSCNSNPQTQRTGGEANQATGPGIVVSGSL